jgi:hypothetical protein
MWYNYSCHKRAGVLFFAYHRAVSNELLFSCDKEIGKRWMRLFVLGG